VDHKACILWTAYRGSGEIATTMSWAGAQGQPGVAFDLNVPMGNSDCVSCGESMVAVHRGLTHKTVVQTVLPGKPVEVEDLQELPYFQKSLRQFLSS